MICQIGGSCCPRWPDTTSRCSYTTHRGRLSSRQLSPRLCPGRRHSNDYLLPTIITFLNDRDWQLRAAFFRHIACLAPTTGFTGLEAFLLPCVEQARLHTRCSCRREAVKSNLDPNPKAAKTSWRPSCCLASSRRGSTCASAVAQK